MYTTVVEAKGKAAEEVDDRDGLAAEVGGRAGRKGMWACRQDGARDWEKKVSVRTEVVALGAEATEAEADEAVRSRIQVGGGQTSK